MSAPTRARAATMTAAVVVAPETSRAASVPVPEPAVGEVLFRVEGCGVCGSSLPVWEGRPWFTYPCEPGSPGHEAWGTVEQGPDDLVGRRVCALSSHAFAAYDVAPVEHVVELPPALEGRAFPGEAIACAVNVVARARVEHGSRVAVVGIGFLGAVVTRLCALAGAEVVAYTRRAYARAVALQLGAYAATPLDDDAGTEAFDVAIECVGSQDALDLASRLVRTRGVLAVAGFHQDGRRSVDLQSWNWRGLDVVNAHERDPLVYVEAMREGARLAAAGALDLDDLYTEFGLERLGDAFDAMRARPDGFLKAVVVP